MRCDAKALVYADTCADMAEKMRDRKRVSQIYPKQFVELVLTECLDFFYRKRVYQAKCVSFKRRQSRTFLLLLSWSCRCFIQFFCRPYQLLYRGREGRVLVVDQIEAAFASIGQREVQYHSGSNVIPYR